MVLYYKKEKKNELKNITVGNSSSSEDILYYKVVDNDEVIYDMPVYQTALIMFFDLIVRCYMLTFKVTDEHIIDNIGRIVNVTGSQEVVGDDTQMRFKELMINKKIKGFSLLNLDCVFYNNRSVEDEYFDSWEKIICYTGNIKERLMKYTIEQYGRDNFSEEEQLIISRVNECLDKTFIKITKEEYEKL